VTGSAKTGLIAHRRWSRYKGGGGATRVVGSVKVQGESSIQLGIWVLGPQKKFLDFKSYEIIF